MNDRTLLELAARAAGIEVRWRDDDIYLGSFERRVVPEPKSPCSKWLYWRPSMDDGDALRLAVRLNLDIRYESYDSGVAVIVGGAWDGAPEAVHEIFERDGPRATRRAIVRAAAEIGKSMGGWE
ncbi:hypothetical protein ACKWWR_006364 [Pseudomonas aeruginosa]|uniref:hypothetical protein n=1 Tax=Pseudomonas aeruginosa TaxID=287 RepID=UPI000D832C04|nr:hypothetical protein [Pseudomonas aeruginosa]EKT8084291.1 hypothetical protein [Pseudomonas aeruginosa]EKT8459340.1 hypothetical protein [Pseudomonas aeruginosa]EKU0566038.1 hypothetical protein [Pseudomonas aeruginosa]EKV9103518.1 hypothetical protein [Pseudomonas aeruginosa]EKW6408304.1 hypothetical protein [Pseudomonas aeruginosa]